MAPEEAIDYFKSKDVVTRKEFDLLAEDARSAAFTVSGIYKKQVLQGFKDEIAKSLEEGTPQRKVIKRFREIIDGVGHRQLGAFHLETIFRTNMAMSYGVGRRRALEGVADDLPYWQYHTVGDDRVRPEHEVLNGIILPANHEFWQTHFPPWSFNCRCSATALDSIPDSYDHNNPSGEGTIYYDDLGMPAKAEIGTSVYDLAAGDFRGVPPQGRLGEVIKDSIKRAESLRANAGKRRGQKAPTSPRLERGQSQPFDQTLNRVEREIARRKTEKAVLLDKDGTIVLQKTSRLQDQVVFEPDELKQLAGRVLTHNHTPSSSFSREDIKLAMEWGLAEIRAVGKTFRHSMMPAPEGWSQRLWEDTIEQIVLEEAAKIDKWFTARATSGTITAEEYELNLWHEIWIRVAKKTGLRYERKRW